MSLTSTVATVAVQLPMPAWVFGAASLGAFLMLLGVLWSFRNTAAKYDTPIPVTEDARRAAHGPTDPGAQH